ncbi:hypothetical protein AURDEDRAFT_176685 [Auricularia subglabra TFB-10046 SS5]|uniref:Uncharacterized protein n=1 Tax=Auricularia subglabra (strain TFB-10046 / SS5) TaxID=717982 RepID=J0WQT3_AURST|nr:hypothetical protein AURDEDRAFT_176685 [Auricularia subglabra TFB-10046 SS5]
MPDADADADATSTAAPRTRESVVTCFLCPASVLVAVPDAELDVELALFPSSAPTQVPDLLVLVLLSAPANVDPDSSGIGSTSSMLTSSSSSTLVGLPHASRDTR